MANQDTAAGDAAPKAPDNNKRYQQLEARHKAFSEGLVKLKLATGEEVTKDEFDPGALALSTIEKLQRSVKSHQGAATKAKAKLAEAAERDPQQKARDIGPLNGDMPTAAALLDAIGDAKTIEVVASDGKKELIGVPPLKASGPGAFRILNGQLLLADGTRFEVPGPAPGQRSLSIAGWGLVLDGKQVAYRKRGDGPLTLGGGVTMNLAGDPVF